MTLCERCVHKDVCEIRSNHDEDDERALVECSDFFEIIRCKDCKHWWLEERCSYLAPYPDEPYMNADDFCSCGERKGAN